MPDIVAKDLGFPEGPEDRRVFGDGSERTTVRLASAIVGRGEYLPGWKWSEHARPQTGRDSESHIGYVISGRIMVMGADGLEVEVGPGEAFEAEPGHDAWVVGDETCIALDFHHLLLP